VDRKRLRELALTRLREARVLLEAGEPSGAYYLAGYAVECGLKACIAKQVRRHEFPDKATVNKSHTHSLPQLVGVGADELQPSRPDHLREAADAMERAYAGREG
jgi:HEPN domain-containing protein